MKFVDSYEQEGLRRQIQLERSNSVRSPISRGKHLDKDIDWACITVKNRMQLIDPVTGKFFFIIGVSIVGGGDIVQQ